MSTAQAQEETAPPEPAGRAPTRRRVRGFRPSFAHSALAPLVLLMVVLLVLPLVELVRLGFSTVRPEGGDIVVEFSGLDNARTMLDDQVVPTAVKNTVLFVVLTTAAQVVLGTALAVAADRARLLRRVSMNVLLWPIVLAPVVVSVVWLFILDRRIGLLNLALGAAGLPEQGWLGSTSLSLYALMLVDIWHWTPLVFLLVFAGLQGIDRTYYEAARIDGATEWQVIRRVTLPLVAPAIAAAAVVRAILAGHTFAEIYLLTGGGPGISSEVLSTYIYEVFVTEFNFGYGAFLSMLLIIVIAGGLAAVLLLRWRRAARRAEQT